MILKNDGPVEVCSCVFTMALIVFNKLTMHQVKK